MGVHLSLIEKQKTSHLFKVINEDEEAYLWVESNHGLRCLISTKRYEVIISRGYRFAELNSELVEKSILILDNVMAMTKSYNTKANENGNIFNQLNLEDLVTWH